MKNMPDTFSVYFTSLQISPFETVILYSLARPFLQIISANMYRWNIFLLIKLLSMLASPQISPQPGISDRSSFLCWRTVKFQFVCQKLCYIIPLAGLLRKHVGLRDSSSEYQKSFVCWRKMCLMVVIWKYVFYRNDDLSTTCQCQQHCRQLKLNPLSTQIIIYCLMTNQMPALLIQRAPWMRAAVMLLQSILYFSCPPSPTAIIPDARPLGTLENQDGGH